MNYRYLADLFQQAAWGLRDNAKRSILSVIGITVGILAVIVLDALGKGAHQYIFSELETFGLSTVWVHRDYRAKDPNRAIRAGTGINNEDYFIIKNGCCPSVEAVSPVISSRTFGGFGESYPRLLIRVGNQYSNARLEGVSEDFLAVNGDSLLSGRNFSVGEVSRGRRLALLTPQAVQDLFRNQHEVLGRTFRIKDKQFTVVGVLRDKSRELLSSAGVRKPNHRILIPYTAYQAMLGSTDISRFQLKAKSGQQSSHALGQVMDLLARRHTGQFDYTGQSMWEHVQTADRILSAVKVVGVVAALVSLLVGALGITNIMYTSVLERTREIGLRKAIGARHRDILLQFLLEATLISSIGGVVGIVLGVYGCLLMSWGTGFPLVPNAMTIATTSIVAAGIGLLSGFLPARHAAGLEPERALRYE